MKKYNHPRLKSRKGFKRVMVTGDGLIADWSNEFLYAVSWTANRLIIYDLHLDYRQGWVERRREYEISKEMIYVMRDGEVDSSTWRGKNGDGIIGKKEMSNFISFAYYSLGGVSGHGIFKYNETMEKLIWNDNQ